MAVDLRLGDCLDVLPTLADASVDSIVTDPPYGLGFMGKEWDTPGALVERKPDRSVKWDKVGGNHNPTCSADAARTRRVEGRKLQDFSEAWARECLRVLKPGGHLLAFSGSRTYHRMVCAIEDAGFEIRDQIMWLFSQGFPKSHSVNKALGDTVCTCDAEQTTKRDLRFVRDADVSSAQSEPQERGAWPHCERCGKPTIPAGLGSALKPAHEPIVLARKPLEGTVAANVLKHGTGGLNIDGCRVGVDPVADATQLRTMRRNVREGGDGWGMSTVTGDRPQVVRPDGRWPANIIHDGSDEVVALFGEPARFFYSPKASKRDRDAGCGDLPEMVAGSLGGGEETRIGRVRSDGAIQNAGRPSHRNTHPTVKPTDLMRYLCRLVTPPGGTVLDPFMGSGSTGRGAVLEGFSFIGIEREAEYHAIAERRIDDVASDVSLLLFAVTPMPRVASGG